MSLFTLLRQSLKAIFANKGRSFLTILGIIIGIGSVIALVALGAGVRASVSDRMSSLGAANITVMPGGAMRGLAGLGQEASTLTFADLNSLADRTKHPLVSSVTGQISASAIINTPDGDQRFSIIGTTETYAAMQGLSLKDGSFISPNDVRGKSKVVILGSDMATTVFGNQNPLGASLNIGGTVYKVVGVLTEADSSNLNDPNDEAFIPYTAAADTFKTQYFSTITAQAVSDSSVEAAKWDINYTLMTNHHITDAKLADFGVLSSAQVMSTVNDITSLLTSLLAGIAAISLVVGGIGIMNIMLVSVTERTREIGLRKAVGARTGHILFQFIVEAVLLTVAGGVVGIGLGVFASRVAARFIGFTPIVTEASVILAVGVASAVGLLFGVYPAAKAAMLNPIDALRHE